MKKTIPDHETTRPLHPGEMPEKKAERTLPTFAPGQILAPDGRWVGVAGHQVPDERYELVEEIGKGASAKLWRALDLKNNRREVCIKVLWLSEEMHDLIFGQAADAVTLSHGVADNPYVIQVLDNGTIDHHPFVVMPFFRGLTIRDCVRMHMNRKEGDPGDAFVTFRFVWNVALQCARGLNAIHEQASLHCDLSPGNIAVKKQEEELVSHEQERVIILDPGSCVIARIEQGVYSLGGKRRAATKGTPGFAPPEQQKGIVDESTDLFALAAVLYYMLTGTAPFTAGDMEYRLVPVTVANANLLRLRDAGVSTDALHAFFVKALSTTEDKDRLRYKSVLQFVRDFQQAIAPFVLLEQKKGVPLLFYTNVRTNQGTFGQTDAVIGGLPNYTADLSSGGSLELGSDLYKPEPALEPLSPYQPPPQPRVRQPQRRQTTLEMEPRKRKKQSSFGPLLLIALVLVLVYVLVRGGEDSVIAHIRSALGQ
ncbi:MAG TPA: serine/threonine-protein kinase [Candidatus Kapabacteria bacterium]|nr:serine/threonine-protein kinase [Candidatus Kapabacteria bacterium]